MQTTSATWKALAARIGSTGGLPVAQVLSLYSGDNLIYTTDNEQHIVLYSGEDVICDSDDPQTVLLYSGTTPVYNSEAGENGDIVILQSRVTINGTEYIDNITFPTISRTLMQNGLSIGGATSASCRFSILTQNTIPRAATVKVDMRLTDGTSTSEWLPAGTFFISRRTREAVTGLVTLECFDSMLKANAEYEATGNWPRAMSVIVPEIAATLGVEVDARTQIETGDAYMVSLPEQGTTINAILSGIASVHCGNWIITNEGKLRLVPVVSSDGAVNTGALEVVGVVGALNVEATQTVTGLRVTTDDGDTIIGDDTGIVVDVNSPYINEDNVSDLRAKLIGQNYQGYAISQAIYDPAAEVGDYVRAGADNEVMSVIYGETVTLGMAFRGDLTALAVEEISDEYPYIGASDSLSKQIRRLSVVVADKATIEDLNATNAKLDHLDVSDITSGLIHSANYQTVVIPMIYPATTLYPASTLYPNIGEMVTHGFAIDFATGQIYGNFSNT